MKRLLPAPLLSAALFALWILLNRSAAAGDLLMAAVVAVAMPALLAPLRPLPVRIRHPLVLAKLILTVGFDVLHSNLEVAWGVLRSPLHDPHSRFIRIPLELRDAHALAALATITTVVPGTIWSELAPDRSALLLHMFHLDDEQAFIARFKARYEKPLMEIFE